CRGVIGHPEANDTGFQHLRRPRRFDLREETLSDRAAGSEMHRRQTFLLTPGFQRASHATDCACRILPAHDGLVEYFHHAALRGELGDAQGILLPLMSMAVNVDRVIDSNHPIERGIDGLLKTAASRVRGNRANCARRGVVLLCVVHGQSSRPSNWLDNSLSLRDGQTFFRLAGPDPRTNKSASTSFSSS